MKKVLSNLSNKLELARKAKIAEFKNKSEGRIKLSGTDPLLRSSWSDSKVVDPKAFGEHVKYFESPKSQLQNSGVSGEVSRSGTRSEPESVKSGSLPNSQASTAIDRAIGAKLKRAKTQLKSSGKSELANSKSRYD